MAPATVLSTVGVLDPNSGAGTIDQTVMSNKIDTVQLQWHLVHHNVLLGVSTTSRQRVVNDSSTTR
jgi:hypothetical protein